MARGQPVGRGPCLVELHVVKQIDDAGQLALHLGRSGRRAQGDEERE